MKIYCGDVCMGDVGTPAHDEFHVGDIVLVYRLEHEGSEFERWEHTGHLSAVVCEGGEPFVMGIRQCGFDDPKWRVDLIKKHTDVIPGEHWTAFGFRYV